MKTYEVDVGGKVYEVDAPDEATAWRYANQHAAIATRERAGKTAQLNEELRQGFAQAEAAEPLMQRIRANVGAGMHNVVQGVAGIPRLFGADVGPTDEEVAEDRARKAQLAQTVPGGKLMQIGGEIVPSLAIPSGALGTGARVLGRAFPRTLGMRALDVGVTGAGVAGATTPGDWGERAVSATLGGVGGAAVPLGTAGAVGAYRMARPTAAGRAAGREAGVASRMAADLGEEKTGELIAKLDQPATEFGRAGVARPTAAQLTRDPTLQQLETGLRVQRPDLFKAIDEAAATGRWGELSRIAKDEEALQAAMKARGETTDVMRTGALEAAGKVKGFEAPVAQAVESILTGESRTIPQARTLANWVKGELAEGVTPGQLYSMRKSLTSGIPHGTELGSAMSQARAERVALVGAIDEALDAASGGQWKPYLAAYQELSAPVTSMKTGQAIQKAFESTSNRTAEGLPVITPHVLRRTLAKHGTKQFGSKTVERLTPQERETVEAIARSAEAENAARMAQGTVGSATAGNIAAANRVMDQVLRGAVTAATGGTPGAGAAVDLAGNVIGRMSKRRREQAFADLLADPERLREALIAAAATGRREELVTEAARATRAIPGVLD